MKILIHTCCADCFLNTLSYLTQEHVINSKTQITLLFFNPNIHPRSEYLARFEALKKVVEQNNDYSIKIVTPDYKPAQYIASVVDVKDNKNLSRCKKCWKMRLEYTVEYALANNFDAVTTTLLTSHYQNRDQIIQILENLTKKQNINIIKIDSSHNSKHKGFYKQPYCGCCFSLTEKMLQNWSNQYNNG
ncbi:MAG TPA: epoxyqueuosine reductase QueH [Candidatus Dojkabacteria bacterium]|nr:epoxyqueuosine reductase QueH [Candidatus Dojkabacteria bacterium]